MNQCKKRSRQMHACTHVLGSARNECQRQVWADAGPFSPASVHTKRRVGPHRSPRKKECATLVLFRVCNIWASKLAHPSDPSAKQMIGSARAPRRNLVTANVAELVCGLRGDGPLILVGPVLHVHACAARNADQNYTWTA
jgi:hypothetical protein